MIGTVLFLIAMGGLAWLTHNAIKLKEEEKKNMLAKYRESKKWLEDAKNIQIITNAKESWLNAPYKLEPPVKTSEVEEKVKPKKKPHEKV